MFKAIKSGRSRPIIRGNFVTEEQLEVARNGAVHQASSRGEADRFVLSSATKSPPDSVPGAEPSGQRQAMPYRNLIPPTSLYFPDHGTDFDGRPSVRPNRRFD